MVAPAALVDGMNRPRRPSLALVGTGGTIAGAGTAPEGGMSAAYQSAVVGADALVAGVPALARLAELRAEQLLQIDSADFTDALLLRLAGEVGLDVARAAEILASDTYADEVREREQFYLQHGIRSVPAIIINEQHLISGGQPVEVFEQALRQLAA